MNIELKSAHFYGVIETLAIMLKDKTATIDWAEDRLKDHPNCEGAAQERHNAQIAGGMANCSLKVLLNAAGINTIEDVFNHYNGRPDIFPSDQLISLIAAQAVVDGPSYDVIDSRFDNTIHHNAAMH